VGDCYWLIHYGIISKFEIDTIKQFESNISLHGYMYPITTIYGYPAEITVGKNTFKNVLYKSREQAEVALKGEKG
jgi:hypothetical protein